MEKDDVIKEVVLELNKVQFALPRLAKSNDELKKLLSEQLDYLIKNNFSRLVYVLYRLDISEKKLKELLSTNADVPAADIIAEMIIERQLQKIAARKLFKRGANDIPEEEKW